MEAYADMSLKPHIPPVRVVDVLPTLDLFIWYHCRTYDASELSTNHVVNTIMAAIFDSSEWELAIGHLFSDAFCGAVDIFTCNNRAPRFSLGR